MLSAAVFYWAAKRRKLNTQGIATLAAVAFIAGIIGAKLSQLIFGGLPPGSTLIDLLNPRLGGRALLGGVLFGWLGVEIAKRRMGIRRSTGDLFALALPAGEAIGRIGCFFNTCCYGVITDVPWAVHQHDALRHPVQLYSAVVAAILFAIMLWLSPRLKREGDLFRAYLIGFGLTRFMLEFYREGSSLLLGLSAMQWLCLELIVGTTAWLWVLQRRQRATAQIGETS